MCADWRGAVGMEGKKQPDEVPGSKSDVAMGQSVVCSGVPPKS